MERRPGFNPGMELEDLPDGLAKTLAINLRALKTAREVSEGKIARSGGIATGSVHRATHGQNVTLDVLDGLAAAFGLPAWALLHPDLNPSTFDTATPPQLVTRELLDELAELRALRSQVEAWARGPEGSLGSGDAADRPNRREEPKNSTR